MPNTQGGSGVLARLRRKIAREESFRIVAEGSAGALLAKTAAAGIAFGVNAMLARVLGRDQYGVYVYVLAWIAILTMLAKLGLDTTLTRYVSAYRARKEWSLLRGLLRRSMMYALLASTLTGIMGFLLILVLYDQVGREQANTFWISFLLLPLATLAALRQGALQGLRLIVHAEVPDNIMRPVLLGMLVGGAYLGLDQQLTASTAMAYNLVAAFIALVLGTFLLWNALPAPCRSTKPAFVDAEWLRVAIPLLFISGMHVVLSQADIIMLGYIETTGQAGIYAAANRIAGFAVYGLVASNAIVAPMISELWTTNRRGELQRMVTFAARGVSAFTMLIAAGLVAGGPFLLSLFGREFEQGYTALLILLGGQIVNALAGPVGFLMSMTGHQRPAVVILTLTAAANIALNAILIPEHGMQGAAIATAVSMTAWNLAMWWFVKQKININASCV